MGSLRSRLRLAILLATGLMLAITLGMISLLGSAGRQHDQALRSLQTLQNARYLQDLALGAESQAQEYLLTGDSSALRGVQSQRNPISIQLAQMQLQDDPATSPLLEKAGVQLRAFLRRWRQPQKERGPEVQLREHRAGESMIAALRDLEVALSERNGLQQDQAQQADLEALGGATACLLVAFGVMLLLAFSLQRRVLQPLALASEQAERIAGGDLQQRLDPLQDVLELRQFSRAINDSLDTAERQRQQLEQRQRQVEHLQRMAQAQISVGEVLLDRPALNQEMVQGLIHALAEPLDDWSNARAWVYPESGGPAQALPALGKMVLQEPLARQQLEQATRSGTAQWQQWPQWECTTVMVPVLAGDRPLGGLELCADGLMEEQEQTLAMLSLAAQHVASYVERRQGEQLTERLKDEFFSMISHEFRTPLTSILGYVSLMLDGMSGDPEQIQGFLRTVERNAHRLLHLIDDLLFAAQLEAGRLALHKEECDLAELATKAWQQVLGDQSERMLELQLPAEPCPLRADPGRCQRLIAILLDNALRYSATGDRIQLRLEAEGDGYVLEVQDSGRGISEAELPRVFERFFRAAELGDQSVAGAGLGLAIGRAVAEGHGGTLEASSQLGEGSCFVLRLPRSGEPEELQELPEEWEWDE